MATNWTDPTLTTSSHIRATHINELRSVVSQNRKATGLQPYPWQDVPASTRVHIRAAHFTDLHDAIQELWNRETMGDLPNWSYGSAPSGTGGRPISLRDTTDLRTWVQAYQDKTGVSYQPIDPVIGPFRGVHLPHGGDLRAIDQTALADFAPGAVVALLSDVYAYTQNQATNPNLFNWLVNNQTNMEIFLRYFPTPVVPLNTPTYQNYHNLLEGSAQYLSATDAAADLVKQVKAIQGAGLSGVKVIVGNEPEAEWDTSGSAQWFTSFWQDVNKYYVAVYDAVVASGVSLELYPPAFPQGAFVAIESINSQNGLVVRRAQSPMGKITYTGAQTDFGAYYVQELIDHYNNGGSVGRLALHSYFWPGYVNQVIDRFLPDLINARIEEGLHVRVTEFGWWPCAVAPAGGCPTPNCNPANLDTTTTSCDGQIAVISAATDYRSYLRTYAGLGGYSFWLLADPTNFTPGAVAVDSGGYIRTWFGELINAYNSQ